MEKLALLGGTPVVTEKAPEEMFKWPIITQEDIDNVIDVVVNNKFSYEDITEKFGQDIADLLDFFAEQDKSFLWRENKEIVLKHLAKASQRKQMLVLADELSNIEDIVRDFEKLGDFYWKIYQEDREEKEWYFRAVVKALSKLEEDYDVKYYYHRFVGAVDYVFDLGNSESDVKNS